MKRADTRLILSLAVSGMLLLCSATWSPVMGDDLDDGIPIDDSIDKYDQIGDHVDTNFSYLSLRARSEAAARVDDTDTIVRKSDDSLLNSVILKPGATVQGDIIIIDQSRGDKTIVAQ